MLGSRAEADGEWAGYGRRVEAHLAHLEAEIGALRDVLRAAGIDVHRQRTRIQPENEKALRALAYLRDCTASGFATTPTAVAHEVDCSPEYAYDLLMALVAQGKAQRTGRGRYQAAE